MSSYPTWQTAHDQVKTYSRRRPEETSLYRLIYHYREQFEYFWDELFAERYGFLRPEVLEAFDGYLNCGILKHGCALACCTNEECKHSMLIAFSCKRRGICPSCQTKRSVLFAENLNEVLLKAPHRHLVFTIPKRLRCFFRFDRHLFSHLYRAAWETWNEYVSAIIPGGKTGAVMALHTSGSTLNWHPHIHGIALDGVVLDDGAFVQLPEVDVELLQEFFAEKVFAFLQKEQLIYENTVNSMKSWPHSGFHLYAGEPIPADDNDARLFIARYLRKAPLALERLSIDESGPEPVVCYAKPQDDIVDHDEADMRTFTPLEFLAELSLQIPLTFEQTTRWNGVYSPRTRGAERKKKQLEDTAQNNFEPLDPSLPETPASQSWARCMKLVFELDPLLCPKCSGEMKIKSFVTAPHQIERLCKYLGLSSWRAPPRPRSRQTDFNDVWLDDSNLFSQIR